MNNSTAWVLGLIYVLSELGLTLKKRAKAEESRDADRGSLALLWVVIVASVTLAFSAAYTLPAAGMREVPHCVFRESRYSRPASRFVGMPSRISGASSPSTLRLRQAIGSSIQGPIGLSGTLHTLVL